MWNGEKCIMTIQNIKSRLENETYEDYLGRYGVSRQKNDVIHLLSLNFDLSYTTAVKLYNNWRCEYLNK